MDKETPTQNPLPARRCQGLSCAHWGLSEFVRGIAVVCVTVGILPFAVAGGAAGGLPAENFGGQDLHITAENLTTSQAGPEQHILMLAGGCSIAIGDNVISSDSAVIWLDETNASQPRGAADYEATCYLKGAVSVKKGKAAKTTHLAESVIEAGQTLLVRFEVAGQVFTTAEVRRTSDPRESELYGEAEKAVRNLQGQRRESESGASQEEVKESSRDNRPADGAQEAPPETERLRYPVNIAGVGRIAPEIEKTTLPDGTEIATVIGRFYLWQNVEYEGRLHLLELEADSAVIFFSESGGAGEPNRPERPGLLPSRKVRAAYLAGDIVMRQGSRTIRADEIYYDFIQRKALAVKASMRTFDPGRGIPIYVRADRLRQVAANKFAAEDVTLTTSEFYLPQLSVTASEIIVTDNTSLEPPETQPADSSFQTEIFDLGLNLGETTIFRWPYMKSNLQRPDLPIKSMHISHDSNWGTGLETRWYLSRLLGLSEPEGVDSTLALDYFSERGPAGGAEIEYSGADHFGIVQGYVIHDSGEDRLGRAADRRNLEPPRELRGRFRLQHRQFLPYDWQLTLETSYISDENFLESFYRNEFNTGKDQETVLHLKNIRDNRALSILGKWRVNDFASELEELPSVEYHLTGQSLFDDRLTFYSDTIGSRFRYRPGDDTAAVMGEDFYTFAATRNELDLPLRFNNFKVVPYTAGTFALDDGPGFTAELDGDTIGSEDKLWLGEAGVRAATNYWKVYPDIHSRLWDVNGIRHIVTPQISAAAFTAEDSAIDQRDTFSFGLLQRWQTKRGPAGDRRTVEWMRLDTRLTWVKDSVSSAGAPDRLIWNKPFIPLVNRYDRDIPPDDRRSTVLFGPRRNYFSADYLWRVTDTTALLSDMYFDMQSGTVQQYDIGLARMRWPNLSYYIGSRYLRSVRSGDEVGSNALTFSATWMLNERYTLVFNQQYDFDYSKNLRSDLSLIRRYHRIYCGLTYSADESLDTQAVVFSIWPQGVPELAVGPRRYIGLAGAAGYD